MSQKEGVWFCDVCDGSIAVGSKRYPLDGGRICCSNCWAEVSGTTVNLTQTEFDRLPVAQTVCEMCGMLIPSGQPYFDLPNEGSCCNKCWQRPVYVASQVTVNHSPAIGSYGRTSGAAVASMVTALVGIFVFGLILGIIALALGSAALSGMSRDKHLRGSGMAVAGIIIGILDVIGWAILLIYWLR